MRKGNTSHRPDNIIPSLIVILFPRLEADMRVAKSELYDSRETTSDTPSSFKDFSAVPALLSDGSEFMAGQGLGCQHTVVRHEDEG